MSQSILNFSTIVFLTLASIKGVNAATYKTGNDNFSLTYNTQTEVADVTLSSTYLKNNPYMDSFWLVATPNNVPEKGVKLVGDLRTNTISAYAYNHGSNIQHGKTINNTHFDDGIIVRDGIVVFGDGAWNTLHKGDDITDGWTVLNGNINLKDAKISIDYNHGVGKTSGKHIDLDGHTAGTIGKTIKTTPGETYTLTFEHTASPAVDNVRNKDWQPNKEFKFKVGDKEFDYTSKFIESGTWKQETLTFTATSETTDIHFISGSEGVAGHTRTGVYLDDIRISKDTDNGEFLGVIYGAISSNNDSFSVDLTDINKKITALGGQKFEIGETAGIWFKSGSNSDAIYTEDGLVRYNPTIGNIANYRDANTEITGNSSAVSEPTGLLAMLTAISLFFAKKRHINIKK